MANDTWSVDLKLKDKTGGTIKGLANQLKNIGNIDLKVNGGGFSKIGVDLASELKSGVVSGVKSGLGPWLATFGTFAAGAFAADFAASLRKSLSGKFDTTLGYFANTALRQIVTNFSPQATSPTFDADLTTYIKLLTDANTLISITDKVKQNLADIAAKPPIQGTKLQVFIGELKDSYKALQQYAKGVKAVQGINSINGAAGSSNSGGLNGIGMLASKAVASADKANILTLVLDNLGAKIAGLVARVGPAIMSIGGLTAGFAALAAAAVLAVPAMAAVQKKALDMAMPFLQAAGQLEGMRNSIRALTNDADKLIPQIEKLAKMPGVSLEGVYMGMNKMMAAGLDGKEAMAYVYAFSKISPSAEKFKSTMEAVGQILNKDKLSAEEIRGQLGDSTTGLAKLLKAEFGTANSEDLVKKNIGPQEFAARLVSRINKDITRGGSQAQNAIDNLTDAMFKLKASLGTGLATTAVPLINDLVTKVDGLVESGKIEEWGKRLATVFGSGALEQTIDGLVWIVELGSYAVQTVGDISTGFVQVGIWIQQGTSWLWNMVEGAAKFTQEIVGWMTLIKPFFLILDGITKLLTGKSIGDNLTAQLENLSKSAQGVTDFAAGFARGGILGGIGNMVNRARARSKPEDFDKSDFAKELVKVGDESAAKAKAANPGVDTGRDMVDLMKAQIDLQRELVKNTKPDIQRSILGGGNLGAMGITSTELNSTKTIPKPSQKLPAKATKALMDFGDALLEEFARGQREAARAFGY